MFGSILLVVIYGMCRMPDILIRNMEMPKVGEKIEFTQNIAGRIYAKFNPSRGYVCEVIELPEHGNLIDRGEIVAHYRKCECNLGSDRHLEFLTVHDWIEEGIVYDLLNAPVIVPADKEDGT